MTPRPPTLATWLIRSSAPPADRDVVLGDLEEEFRGRTARDGVNSARRWYWRQARRSAPHSLRRRLLGEDLSSGNAFRAFGWLDGTLQDVRRAARALRATPGFTVAALTVLALGIGATTAIYSVVDGVVLRGLGYPDDSRLMLVSEPNARSARTSSSSMPEFHDWRASQTAFTDLGASRGNGLLTSRDGDTVEHVRMTLISASLLPVLRASPAIGRAITPQDEIPGNDHVALLSDGYWRRRFGARTDIVGRTLTFDSGTWTVVGVMPERFMYPAALTLPMDMWAPLATTPADLSRTGKIDFSLTMIGRLKPGMTAPLAQADLERITSALRPTAPKWFDGRGVKVTSWRDAIVGPVRSWMLMLLGSVAFVLALACVNVANLVLARTSSRARDTAVRAALGATRWRMLRGLLIESLLLSIVGTGLGVVLALWGVDVLRSALPANLPRLAEVAVNYRVLLAAGCLAIAVAIAVTPVWQTSPRRTGGTLR
jgi:predicted permease